MCHAGSHCSVLWAASGLTEQVAGPQANAAWVTQARQGQSELVISIGAGAAV